MTRKIAVFAAVLFIALRTALFSAPAPVKVDEEKLIPNIRKSLSVPLNWSIRITGVQQSPIPNIYQGVLELAADKNQRSQLIFISTDNNHYIVGNIFDANTDLDEVRKSLIMLKDVPIRGNPDAPVTIVEYLDLQCESCKVAHDLLKKENLLESYKGKVRLVYKFFTPTPVHHWAEQASLACWCARSQKTETFLKMMDSIFEKQNEIRPENVAERVTGFAQLHGLNVKTFKECLEKKIPMDRLQADKNEADSIGIFSTPTFFVNGRVIRGQPDISQLRLLIDQFLAQPQK